MVFSLLAVWSWKSVSVSVAWSRASLQNADFKQKLIGRQNSGVGGGGEEEEWSKPLRVF